MGLVGRLATPLARGCSSARNPSDPLGRCRPVEIVLHRDTYAHRPRAPAYARMRACIYVRTYVPDPDTPTHRHTADVCARRSNNYGHRDIGPRRTHDEGTRNAYERAYSVRATWSARTLSSYVVWHPPLSRRGRRGNSLRNGMGIIDTRKVARSLGIFNDGPRAISNSRGRRRLRCFLLSRSDASERKTLVFPGIRQG